jgi:hypothetical protein
MFLGVYSIFFCLQNSHSPIGYMKHKPALVRPIDPTSGPKIQTTSIKRPMLSDRHQRLCLAWCLARRCLNFRTWRRIYWSDESWFVLHVTDGAVISSCLKILWYEITGLIGTKLGRNVIQISLNIICFFRNLPLHYSLPSLRGFFCWS